MLIGAEKEASTFSAPCGLQPLFPSWPYKLEITSWSTCLDPRYLQVSYQRKLVEVAQVQGAVLTKLNILGRKFIDVRDVHRCERSLCRPYPRMRQPRAHFEFRHIPRSIWWDRIVSIDITNVQFELECVSVITGRIYVRDEGVSTLSKCSCWASMPSSITFFFSGFPIIAYRFLLAATVSSPIPNVFRSPNICLPFLTLCIEFTTAIWRLSDSYVSSRLSPACPLRTNAILYARLCTSPSPEFRPRPPVGGNECAASPALHGQLLSGHTFTPDSQKDIHRPV